MTQHFNLQTSDDCSICQQEVEDEMGIKGFFGILPVAFCQLCLDSMIDMVESIQQKEGGENGDNLYI